MRFARVWAAIRWDVVRQVRAGFYLVSILLIVIMAGLLRWAGAGPAQAAILPAFLVMLLLVTTFYFSAAILLLEKSEGILEGLVVTPLRTDEYLLARVVSLSILAIGEAIALVLIGFGPTPAPLAMIPGMVALCAVYTLVGTAVITRYDSINEFLLPSVGAIILLLVPLLNELGLWRSNVFQLHPIQPAILLMRAGVAPVAPAMLAYAVVAATIWTGISLVLARRAFERFVVRSAGT